MRSKAIFLATLLLFGLLFPLVSKINFFQNDDWVYYEMTGRFMQGDFTLHPYTGPTFYTQGIIGAGFAKIFGIENLPVLTLLVASINFYLFASFVYLRLRKTLKTSVLVGLVYFLNPLNIYLILGYMTAQYFILFLLLSIWLYDLYEETLNKKYLWWLIAVIFLGLLVRQVSLFIPLGIAFYNLFRFKFKISSLFFTIFITLYYYYSNIFPLSPRIIEVPLQYHHLLDFDYTFALIFGTLIVTTAYLFPVFIGSFDFRTVVKKKVKFVLVVLLGIGLYFVALNYFNPHEVSWGEFPYFENTLERTGFYARGLGGTKYQFKWNYDLYHYWDLGAKTLLAAFVSYFLLFKRIFRNVYLWLAVVYLGMLIVTETFYDRYILILIPLALLFLLKNFWVENKLNHILLTGFVLFLGVFAYQLSYDFVLVNRYIWDRAEQLVSEGTAPEEIQATNAWKLTYRNYERDYTYNFSFDSPQVNETYATLYTLVEEKEIKFPGSIFINPKVYLYKLN